jgi:hypothetical protein
MKSAVEKEKSPNRSEGRAMSGSSIERITAITTLLKTNSSVAAYKGYYTTQAAHEWI